MNALTIQEQLIARARGRCGEILPCASRQTLEECFTQLPSGELVFWFNTPDGSTRILRESDPMLSAAPDSPSLPGPLFLEARLR